MEHRGSTSYDEAARRAKYCTANFRGFETISRSRFENRKEPQGSCRQAGRLTRSRRAHNANANVVACGSAEKRCTWIDELAFLPRARVPVACSYPAHALAKHIHTRAHSVPVVLITLMLCMPSPVLGVLSLPSARSHVRIRGPHDGNAWARAAAEGRTAATLAHAVL